MALGAAVLAGLIASSAAAGSAGRSAGYQAGAGRAVAGTVSVPRVTGDARVNRLLADMTLAEKLTFLEGTGQPSGAGTARRGQARQASLVSQWGQAGYLPGVPRLGIPPLRLAGGAPAVAGGLTSGTGLAATFSQPDAAANGMVIGRDARHLGQEAVAAPAAGIIDPYPGASPAPPAVGEDPLLTGQTAAAEVTGMQSQGTMAMVTPYIGAGGGSSVVLGQQALHEIYLQPFADAVRAGVASVMCSGNAVQVAGPRRSAASGRLRPAGRGSPEAASAMPSCGNPQTLGLLRGDLAFPGFVASGWGANHSTDSINDGLDMELPGSGLHGPAPRYFTPSALRAAMASGSVRVSAVNQAVGRILMQMDRFGLLGNPRVRPGTADSATADQGVIQRTAQDAATLLKNSGPALPLSAAALRSLVVIGPGASQTMAMGTGTDTASGLIARQTGTYQVLRRDLRSNHAAGVREVAGLDLGGVPVPASALSHGGWPGLVRTTTGSAPGQVVATLDNTIARHDAFAVGSGHAWAGQLTAPATGTYWLSLGVLGAGATISVDGNMLARTGPRDGALPRYGVVQPGESSVLPAPGGLDNLRTSVHLRAGKHALRITEVADSSGRPVQVRLDWVTPARQTALLDQAVFTARHASAAVVFAWSTGSAGSTGGRAAPLPDGQDQLIADVAAVNPDTVVVLNTDGPVAMPWLPGVRAVLEMWYPGDAGGQATASVLLGRTDPAGHLPFTWPARPSQGAARTARSGGIFVGYRWYDKAGQAPLFPFGYGLSYTRFRYSGLHWSAPRNGGLNVSFSVTNTGPAAGAAVPQVYLGGPDRPPPGAAFALRALVGYTRLVLTPGQTRTVFLHVPQRQLQYWAGAAGWRTAAGQRPLLVSTDERVRNLATTVTIPR